MKLKPSIGAVLLPAGSEILFRIKPVDILKGTKKHGVGTMKHGVGTRKHGVGTKKHGAINSIKWSGILLHEHPWRRKWCSNLMIPKTYV